MVSDQELARYVESLVRQAAAAFPGGTAGISPEAVVRQLEAQLGVDLSPKAPLIRDILLALLAPAPAPAPSPSPSPPMRKDLFAPPPALPSSSSPSAFFSPPQQLHGYASLPPQPSPQYQQQRGSALSPYDASGSAAFRYAQPFAQAGGTQAGVAHLQRLMQQQEAATAAATVAAAATAAATAASSQKESATTGVKRRGGPGGLNKVCGVSPELQAIVGEPTMARTEIVKQLWAYIRRNNLQDPNNKRKIICNDELRLVFETDCTDMFKMNKLLAKHIIPLESRKGSNRDSKKLKPVASEPICSVKDDTNRLPITVSDALANFFGTGEREMLQSEAVSRIWGHIKSNNLEDPTNPTMILCDSKLKELFGCDSIPALGLSELLSCHLFKQS